MAQSQRTARADVNEAEFGSGEGEAAAVDAWEAQLAYDDGEDLTPKAKPNGDKPADDDQDDDDWSADEEDGDEEDTDEEDDEQDDKDDEAEEDDDEAEEDDEGTTGEVDPETKVKIGSGEQETEVTVRELKDGYFRQQDYTQKTQALAVERKNFAAEVQQSKQQWEGYLTQMEDAITTVLGGRSDAEWAKLAQNDRYTYLEEREKAQALTDRLQAVKAEKQRVQQEQQAEQQEQWKQVIQNETDALLKALPSWKDDPNVAARDRSRMLQYAKTLGFSEQEVNGIVDHRTILVLRDAARLHALSAKKEKPSSTKVRTQSKGLSLIHI